MTDTPHGYPNPPMTATVDGSGSRRQPHLPTSGGARTTTTHHHPTHVERVDDTADWHVSVHAVSAPSADRVTLDQRDRFDRYQRVWAEHVASPLPAGGDFEDWVEQAARLDAALATFGSQHCWLHVHRPGGGPSPASVNALSGVGHPDGASLPRWGSQPGGWCQGGGPGTEQGRRADGYASTRTFARHNGRGARLVRGSLRALEDAVQDAWSWRRGAVWVKVNRPKYGIVRLRVPEARRGLGGLAGLTADHDGGLDLLFGAALHLEDDPAAFLVYPEVVMNYEYRLFVVDGTPVCGAGCVEHHTPLDNEALFDPKVSHVRGGGHVERQPGLVARYRAYADEVARDFAEEGLGTYTLDLATTSRGKPLVVECNSLLNSGLYASDPAVVATALQHSPSHHRTLLRY